MLDLDHFKTINDSFGHDTGDAVLEATGALLTHHCAAFGPVVRMGGEEFAILVYASHTEATEHLAHLLRTAIAALRLPCLPEGRQITASIGVAKLAPSETERDAIRRADDALYAAKNGGRDRVEFAAPVGNFALSA
jgi:diguanylate cyclase (GGDEF)-like protein